MNFALHLLFIPQVAIVMAAVCATRSESAKSLFLFVFDSAAETNLTWIVFLLHRWRGLLERHYYFF